MKLLLSQVLGLLGLSSLATSSPIIQKEESSPLQRRAAYQLQSPKNSTSKSVQWDHYSVVLGGQRTHLFCAEFHPWRLPSEDLWIDVLEKFAAGGWNCISTYWAWHIAQPSASHQPVLSNQNDLQRILELTESLGLFSVVRPGPYINAETNGGGFPGWLTAINGTMRTGDADWTAAYEPYAKLIADIIKPHQLTYDVESNKIGGGSVIFLQADNENIADDASNKYMMDLTSLYKSDGVEIAISFNSFVREPTFADIVDIYGYDSYPQNFDCSNPEVWSNLPSDYGSFLESVESNQFNYIPEFQGGAFDPLDGPGYDACAQLTNQNFSRVANLNLYAQRITALSIYMAYGGTNWGGLAEPTVYSSYDYGSAITENRQFRPKYHEYKFQGLFSRSFPDLIQADAANYTSSDDSLFVRELQNVENDARFYFVQHSNSSSLEQTPYNLTVETTEGNFTISSVLEGRDAIVHPTDKTFSKGSHLLYANSRIALASTIGDSDVIALINERGRKYETAWKGQDITINSGSGDDGKELSASDATEYYGIEISKNGEAAGIVSWTLPTSGSGLSYLNLTIAGVPVLFVLGDEVSFFSFYSPVISANTVSEASTYPSLSKENPIANIYLLGTNETVIVSGAPFVRRAAYGSDMVTVHLWGQTNDSTTINVVAPASFTKLTWNGEEVETTKQAYGTLSAQLNGLASSIQSYAPPDLTKVTWKYADSLPEVSADFDDSTWVVANKTSTGNSFFEQSYISTEGQVLFNDDYGFHSNNVLWRGRFDADSQTGIEITLQGGHYFAFSVYLNDAFLGSEYGDKDNSNATLKADFPSGSLKEGSNVLTIIQDSTGLEEEVGGEQPVPERFKQPRGIMSYSLSSNSTSKRSSSSSLSRRNEPVITWKVQGNLDGEQANDKIRTYLNEGGLAAERFGWHLPGFDDSQWETRSPTDGVKPRNGTDSKAGVGFFRTTFDLGLPEDQVDLHDIALRFVFPSNNEEDGVGHSKGNYRAQLYVNGWQYGKRYGALGPQLLFPVPRGVFYFDSENTVAISLWSTEDTDVDSKLEAPVTLEVEAKWRGLAQKVANRGQSYSELRK